MSALVQPGLDTASTGPRDLADALGLSLEIVKAAGEGDMDRLAQLDASRMQLLQSVRLIGVRLAAADRSMLQQIAMLNERALGIIEQQRRLQGQAMDLAAVGRRAVSAYAINRASR